MKLKDLLAQSTVDTPIVRCWEEDVLLPTYETGEFEKNPIFLEKRVYQGSSGVVYPYPVIEKIADQPTQKSCRFYRKPIHQSHDHARTRRSDSNGFR